MHRDRPGGVELACDPVDARTVASRPDAGAVGHEALADRGSAIVRTTFLAFASIRETELSSTFATQTNPPAAAIAAGLAPTGIAQQARRRRGR